MAFVIADFVDGTDESLGATGNGLLSLRRGRASSAQSNPCTPVLLIVFALIAQEQIEGVTRAVLDLLRFPGRGFG